MIERIYADNFRCLVNCEVRLTDVALMLGGNGSGKSAMFDVAAGLHRFIGGDSASAVFPSADLTRWQTRREQRFELGVRLGDRVFQYVLVLKHDPERITCGVEREELSLNDNLVFRFAAGEIQLHCGENEPTTKFLFHGNISGLRADKVGKDNAEAAVFRRCVEEMVFVRPFPILAESNGPKEGGPSDLSSANFPSLHRYLVRQGVFRQLELSGALKSVIYGFDEIIDGPEESPVAMLVKLKIAGETQPHGLKWSELSDGQRQLVFLYTLLFGIDNTARTLFFDEPDNFLSIREVQPWLSALTDAIGRDVSQAIFISHHPEVIDLMARERGIWFSRDGGGATRVTYNRFADDALLRPSEVEARGW